LQSLPDIRTLDMFGPAESMKPGSRSLEKHNYQPGGQQRLARYIADEFVPACNLETAVWQSQVTQARAVKRYVEYLRSHNSINSGCLIWTYNDAAPSISFSMIDAMRQPKAVYYYARRFFAPVLITLTPTTHAGPHHITVMNDSPKRLTATLKCRLLEFDGTVRDEIGLPAAISPYSRSPLYPVPKSFLRGANPYTHFLYLQLFNETDTLAENYYFFEPDKYLQYKTGDINLQIDRQDEHRLVVDIQAKTVVRDLCIIPPFPSRLSDNFITLLPGSSRQIEIRFDDSVPSIQTPFKMLSAGY
jgi:beta-mannosidase